MSDANPGSEALLLSDPESPRAEDALQEGAPPAEPTEPEGEAAEAPEAAPEDPQEAEGAVVAAGAPQDPAEGEVPAEADEEAEPEGGPGPGDALSDEELQRAVAALVFASPEPLGTSRLGALLERPRPGRVKDALTAVQARLEASGLPLELRQIAGGWRLMTAPTENEVVGRLVKARKAEKLSPAGLETLAVVAYRQPVTKAEIEAIRGVQCGAMLRNLVDRGLAKVVGRADVPGGPLQYGTTKEFLDRFGMASLADLPRDGELLKE